MARCHTLRLAVSLVFYVSRYIRKYAYDKFGEQGLAPKKYLTTVGGEDFLLGLSLRIASVLIGETSQGGARA